MEPTTGIRVRVIIDSGNQKSFINGSVRDQLKLSIITKEPLGIKTFGNEEIDRTEKRNKVQFSVGDIGGFSKSRMEANIVPEICAPIGSQEIDRAKRCCAHLEEIDFADGNHVNEEMKIHFNNWSRSYVVLFHWRDKKRRDWKYGTRHWRVNLV